MNQTENNSIWEFFIDYIRQFPTQYTLNNLNPLKPNRDIYVMTFCDSTIINNFAQTQANNNIYLEPHTKFFLTLIPNTTKFFVNLFCCAISMEKIHQRFSDYGLAIEGCFNVEPITMMPQFYTGTEMKTNKIINIRGTEPKLETAFLILDNHTITKIVNKTEFFSYGKFGSNIRYIEGLRLFDNGNVVITNFPDNNTGYLILAFDKDDNIFIMSHANTNMSNMLELLKIFMCKNAILLCETPNPHIIWKINQATNRYNSTNFIGNPSDSISNVITFSA